MRGILLLLLLVGWKCSAQAQSAQLIPQSGSTYIQIGTGVSSNLGTLLVDIEAEDGGGMYQNPSGAGAFSFIRLSGSASPSAASAFARHRATWRAETTQGINAPLPGRSRLELRLEPAPVGRDAQQSLGLLAFARFTDTATIEDVYEFGVGSRYDVRHSNAIVSRFEFTASNRSFTGAGQSEARFSFAARTTLSQSGGGRLFVTLRATNSTAGEAAGNVAWLDTAIGMSSRPIQIGVQTLSFTAGADRRWVGNQSSRFADRFRVEGTARLSGISKWTLVGGLSVQTSAISRTKAENRFTIAIERPL